MHLKRILLAGLLMSLLVPAIPRAEAALSRPAADTGTTRPVPADNRFVRDDADIIPEAAERRLRTTLSGKFLASGIAIVVLTDLQPTSPIELQEKFFSLLEPIPSEQVVIVLMTGEPNIYLISIGEVGDRIAEQAKSSWQPFERALRLYRENRPAEAIDIILAVLDRNVTI